MILFVYPAHQIGVAYAPAAAAAAPAAVVAHKIVVAYAPAAAVHAFAAV